MRKAQVKTVLPFVILLALYNDWLLGPIVNARISTRTSLISELSAQTQSYHWIFQMLDITAGVLTLAALPLLWRFLHKRQISHWPILFVVIAAIGVDSIIDALLPIACAPSVDPACSLAGTHSLLTQAHLIESTLIGIATFIAPLVWWWLNKTKRRFLPQISLWFVVLQIAVGGGILLTRSLHYGVVGVLQRLYELGIGMWVVGILYVALAATSTRPISAFKLWRKPKQLPAPTLALSYDE